MGKRAPSAERMNLLYSNDTQGNYPESWYSATTQHLNAFPSLKGSRKYDICVIGAGYTGLSAALHLSKHVVTEQKTADRGHETGADRNETGRTLVTVVHPFAPVGTRPRVSEVAGWGVARGLRQISVRA